MNKVCISILNRHHGYRFKIEGFWIVFKSFCYNIFTDFPKILVVRGERKRASLCGYFNHRRGPVGSASVWQTGGRGLEPGLQPKIFVPEIIPVPLRAS